RFFWEFSAAIEAFKYGKSVICVDDTHLYGKYKEKLPIALGIDGNRQLLPLALAITRLRMLKRVGLWLNNISCDKWTLLYGQGSRWEDMMTNMIEIFNGVLKGARGLPVTTLVQLSFYRSNSNFVIKRQDGQACMASGAGFTSTIDAKL
ncbi:LOW QUALITY PROTEIN: hypothetical protein CFOL_v3_30801, partial [Cephalotus follicularis]